MADVLAQYRGAIHDREEAEEIASDIVARIKEEFSPMFDGGWHRCQFLWKQGLSIETPRVGGLHPVKAKALVDRFDELEQAMKRWAIATDQESKLRDQVPEGARNGIEAERFPNEFPRRRSRRGN